MIQSLDTAHLHALFSLVDVVPVEDHSVVHHLFSFKVISWSMFPTILKGDVVKIGSADQIRIGDVVVFRQMGALVCHRVTGLGTAGELYTRGDRAQGPGTPIPRHDVVGKVTSITRGGKRAPLGSFQEPCAVTFIRMKVDLFRTAIRHRLVSLALRGVEFIKRSRLVRDGVALALRRLVRVSVGVRAPVRLVHAYRFAPLRRLHDGHVDVFPTECQIADDLIFVAHLGHHPIGTFHPASGDLTVRHAVAGLGLEEYFRELNQKIKLIRSASIQP